MTETEFKYMLTPEEYRQLTALLLSRGGPQNTVVQTNHYLDTPDRRLSAAGIMARFRTKGGHFCEFTVKSGKCCTGALQQCREDNVPVEMMLLHKAEEEGLWISGTRLEETLRSHMGDSVPPKLEVLGSMTTERIFYSIDPELEPLNLDNSSWFDQEDHELEWETDKPEQVAPLLEALFSQAGIRPQITTVSKSGRFNHTCQQKKQEGLK